MSFSRALRGSRHSMVDMLDDDAREADAPDDGGGEAAAPAVVAGREGAVLELMARGGWLDL